MNPVGPEQPSTYWRRRAGVLVALLVVVWLVWWLVQSAFGSDGDAEEPVGQPSASASLGLSLPSSAAPSTSASPTASPGSPAPSTAPKAPKCADTDIVVTVAASDEATGVGDGMALSMTVANTGSQACRRNVGPGANEIRIESGPVLVWSSDFCSPSTAKDTQVLDSNEQFDTSVTWPGRVTAEACPDTQPLAQPGSYRVIARNLALESEPVTFTVQ